MKRPLSASRYLTLALAVVVAAGLSGCQAKLSVAQSFTLPLEDNGVGKIIIMPTQAVAQTISVEVNVKSGPNVDVYVLPANLISENLELTPKEKKEWFTKGFGSLKNVQGGTMTAKVPAKTEFKVLILQIEGAKEKSQVDIKINN